MAEEILRNIHELDVWTCLYYDKLITATEYAPYKQRREELYEEYLKVKSGE